MGENPQLIIESICIVISIGAFNVCGIAVTKYASSAQRATIDSCRTLFIWIVSLGLGWETFFLGQLFGFIILVSGTLIYNEILVVPIEFMNKNTKENLEKKKDLERKSLLDKHNSDLKNSSIKDMAETDKNSGWY